MLMRVKGFTLAICLALGSNSTSAKVIVDKHHVEVSHDVKRTTVIPVVHPTTSIKLPVIREFIKSKCIRDCANPNSVLKAVTHAQKDYDVSPYLILSTIAVESGFRPNISSGKQQGLMQVHMRWHSDKFHGVNPKDIDTNVHVGTNILSDCLKSHRGSTFGAVRCYNGGGFKGYVDRVKKTLKELKAIKVADNTTIKPKG